jgi:hypothetical protein
LSKGVSAVVRVQPIRPDDLAHVPGVEGGLKVRIVPEGSR